MDLLVYNTNTSWEYIIYSVELENSIGNDSYCEQVYSKWE